MSVYYYTNCGCFSSFVITVQSYFLLDWDLRDLPEVAFETVNLLYNTSSFLSVNSTATWMIVF